MLLESETLRRCSKVGVGVSGISEIGVTESFRHDGTDDTGVGSVEVDIEDEKAVVADPGVVLMDGVAERGV